jgi:hypothetical protein
MSTRAYLCAGLLSWFLAFFGIANISKSTLVRFEKILFS